VAFSFAARGIVAVFALAILAGLWQGLNPFKGEAVTVDPVPWTTTERWGVGLYGVGKAVVISPSMVTERDMEVVRRHLRDRLDDRGFVRAYLFTHESAARLWRDGLAGDLPVGQGRFDRDLVGIYERNDRLGIERLSYDARGVRLTEHPRVLQW